MTNNLKKRCACGETTSAHAIYCDTCRRLERQKHKEQEIRILHHNLNNILDNIIGALGLTVKTGRWDNEI